MVPDLSEPIEKLRGLKLAKIQTCNPDGDWITSLVMTLNDGQSCKAGTTYAVNNTYSFTPSAVIRDVEIHIHASEDVISNLVFIFQDGTRKRFGAEIYLGRGRVETYSLGVDEQLIGAELQYSKDYLMSISFITLKRS